MTYHTYQDEKLAARCDQLTKDLSTLLALLVQARTVDGLASNAQVTCLLSGQPFLHNLPVLEELKFVMSKLTDGMAHFDAELNAVNREVQKSLIKDYEEKIRDHPRFLTSPSFKEQ